VAACFGVLATGARGGEIPIAPDLEALGWEPFGFSGLRENRFVGGEDGTLEVVSENSVSALYYPVAPVARCLAWSWRVDEAMPANDLRHRGTDDRPIAVYVAYPFDPDHAGLWEHLKRVFVELAKGPDAPGRVVSYTWGGLGARGDIQPSPYMRSAGRLVLLRPGDQETGVWRHEIVDLAADYQRAFGAPAQRPTQIAVLSDSDSTGSRARALIKNSRFSDECGDSAPTD
jgi:hypothetical protein